MIAWFAETFDQARGQAYDATREQLIRWFMRARH